MSDLEVLLTELRIMHAELTKELRELAALACSVAIASGIPGLDTPEKVVRACAMVREELIRDMKKGRPL